MKQYAEAKVLLSPSLVSRRLMSLILCLVPYSCAVLLHLLRLNVPNHFGVLLDAAAVCFVSHEHVNQMQVNLLGSEETHASDGKDGLVKPGLLVLEGFIDSLVGLAV